MWFVLIDDLYRLDEKMQNYKCRGKEVKWGAFFKIRKINRK